MTDIATRLARFCTDNMKRAYVGTVGGNARHDAFREVLEFINAERTEDDPQPAALCRAPGGCNCGGDLARVRAGCSWWSGQ